MALDLKQALSPETFKPRGDADRAQGADLGAINT